MKIAFTYAALNNIEVTVANIRNAYIQAPSCGGKYVIYRPEFGLGYIGKKALIFRALYGRKTAGYNFWEHLRK